MLSSINGSSKQSDCIECKSGFALTGAKSTSGVYSGTEAQMCKVCSDGKYVQQYGLLCKDCASGTYSPTPANVALAGNTGCIYCAEGKAQAAKGKGSCDSCSVGKYAAFQGQDICSNVPAGFKGVVNGKCTIFTINDSYCYISSTTKSITGTITAKAAATPVLDGTPNYDLTAVNGIPCFIKAIKMTTLSPNPPASAGCDNKKGSLATNGGATGYIAA